MESADAVRLSDASPREGSSQTPGSSSETGSSPFDALLAGRGHPLVRRQRVATLQLNITRRCNLACHHCHVEAGPNRSEQIGLRTAERVVELLEQSPDVAVLDLTGGAPELSEHFRPLVERARKLDRRVIDRCNLTVLQEAGQEDTAQFMAERQVEIVASLPCYSQMNVDEQRGRGVFSRSIEALLALNRLGYGMPDSRLRLDLVYNPQGASLPPPQAELEARYRSELFDLFGIRFHRLLALTNMPIRRFAHALAREGKHAEYISLLVSHFNPEALRDVMCRELVSVDHEGRLYDCDFNQALEIPVLGRARTIWDLSDLAELAGDPISTGRHCFGCTAGAGSSCTGSLVS